MSDDGMTYKLTRRQDLILGFIQEYIGNHGYAPTFREIGSYVGIRSLNGVRDHLIALENKGRIKRTGGTYRAIVLCNGATVTPQSVLAWRETVSEILRLLKQLPDKQRLDVLAIVCRAYCDTGGTLEADR